MAAALGLLIDTVNKPSVLSSAPSVVIWPPDGADDVPPAVQEHSDGRIKSRITGEGQDAGPKITGNLIVDNHALENASAIYCAYSYPEIVKEIRLALQDCGRKLGAFLRRRRRVADEQKKRSYIDQFIPHIGEALREILGLSDKREREIVATLTDTLERSRKL